MLDSTDLPKVSRHCHSEGWVRTSSTNESIAPCMMLLSCHVYKLICGHRMCLWTPSRHCLTVSVWFHVNHEWFPCAFRSLEELRSPSLPSLPSELTCILCAVCDVIRRRSILNVHRPLANREKILHPAVVEYAPPQLEMSPMWEQGLGATSPPYMLPSLPVRAKLDCSTAASRCRESAFNCPIDEVMKLHDPPFRAAAASYPRHIRVLTCVLRLRHFNPPRCFIPGNPNAGAAFGCGARKPHSSRSKRRRKNVQRIQHDGPPCCGLEPAAAFPGSCSETSSRDTDHH